MPWHWLIATPGWVVSLLTFPGVMCHEAAHRLCCDLWKIDVYEAEYFLPGDERSGYIQHAPAPQAASAFCVALGPLFLNTLGCALFGFSPCFTWLALDPIDGLSLLDWTLLWVSLSLGMHAFPSPEDALSVVAHLKERQANGLWQWLGKVLLQAAILTHWGKMLWLDVLYAVSVASLLPWLITHF